MKTSLRSVLNLAGLALLSVSLHTAAALPFTLRFAADGDLNIPFDPDEPEFAYQIGFRTDASVGYDTYDIPAPTEPVPGALIFFMTANDPTIGGYSQDFRPVSHSQTWQLNLLGMTPGKSVTLHWRLEDGSLDGNPIRLYDHDTGALIVDDMMTTTSIQLSDEDQELLLVYGTQNAPPFAVGDEFYMLETDGSIAIPVETILENDYDPNPGDTVSFVNVGLPQLLLGGGKGGTTEYGTTVYDDINGTVIYSLPDVLPADWDGAVAFEYTITDDAFPDPLQGTGTIIVYVAPTIVQEPTPEIAWAQPGAPLTLTYTLRYAGTLHSLQIEYVMPLISPEAMPIWWLYAGGYADDAAAVPPPTIDDGAGPDGILGTEDDLGRVLIDFGTDVPPSGTVLGFAIDVPAEAADKLVQAAATYRLTGTEEEPFEQRLQPADIRMLASVTFVAGTGGTVSGDNPQYPPPGADTTAVTAVPDPGYAFLRWTRAGEVYSTDNPLTVVGSGEDVTLTAEFTALNVVAERDLPACGEPEAVIDVDITVSATDPEDLTAFSITETLPAGWEFEAVTSAPAPEVSPAPGATGTLDFSWAVPPALPFTFTYQVAIPPDAMEPVTFDGTVVYATTGADIPLPISGDTAMTIGDCCTPHDADQNGNWKIEIAPEISRIIQFFNSGGYHCQPGTEDGYAPGPGDQTCTPHDADQNGNWKIEIAPEISRIIQFFNSGGYHCAEGTEDGYAPGPPPTKAGVSSTTKGADSTAATTDAQHPRSARMEDPADAVSVDVHASNRLVATTGFARTGDTPEGMVDVTVILEHVNPESLTSVMLTQTLPEEWTFVEVIDAAAPYIAPEPGYENQLLFGWVNIPQNWPVTLTVRLAMPEEPILPAVIAGEVIFREQEGAQRVKLTDLTVAP